MKLKLTLVAIIIAVIAAFFLFDLGQYLNLEYLKSQKDSLNVLYNNNPVLISAVLLFMSWWRHLIYLPLVC